MSWFAFSVPMMLALAVVVVPGLIVLCPLRMRLLPRLAMAGPLSVGCIGVAGLVSGFTQGGFSFWMVLVVALAASAGMWGCQGRPAFWRSPFSNPHNLRQLLRGTWRHNWQSGASWLAASAFLGVITFCAVDSPARFPQTYDNIFHINGVLWILNTGDASPLDFRQLIEPDRASFYPAGWHSLAALVTQLTQLTTVASPNDYSVLVPAAMNATWLAVACAMWLPGVAWMTEVILAIPADPSRRRIVPLALVLGASLPAMPYAMLSYGSLSPMFLAYATIPCLIALGVLIARRRWPRFAPGARSNCASSAATDGGASENGKPTALPQWFLACIFLFGLWALVCAQPRALPSLALVIAPFVITIGVRAFRYFWRVGGHERKRAVVWVSCIAVACILMAAVSWLAIYILFDVANRPISDHLNGPQATASTDLLGAITQLLTQFPLLGASSGPLPVLGTSILLIVGTVAVLRRTVLRWIGISAIASILLYTLAAGSNSVLAKLATGLWYKDAYRLSSLVAIVAVPVCTWGFVSLLRLGARLNRPRVQRALAVVTPVALLGSSWAVLILSVPPAMANVFSTTLGSKEQGTLLLDDQQIRFLSQIDEIVPEGELVLGDPWDGSALSWLYGERQPVFAHLNGYWDADRATVLSSLTEIDSDPAVCAALQRLNVHYVLYNPGAFLGGDPAGNVFGVIHEAVEAGIFTDVAATDGTNVLYYVSQCSSEVLRQ